MLKQRSEIIRAVRAFFDEQGYLEVDTPVLVSALAPEANIEPIAVAGDFLQTSPELLMKQLLVAGHDQIFQICKCFRAGERGRFHLPEFTMLEWYRAGIDYGQLMAECEALFRYLALNLELTPDLTGQLTGSDPWPRLTVDQAFLDYAGITAAEALARGRFEEVLVEEVEPHLGFGSPLFLYDYPAPLASLARLKKDDSGLAERFELYWQGIELANGFSELNDEAEQRCRFDEERKKIRDQGRDPGPMPEAFLNILTVMPDCAGIALGLDRLIMLLCQALSIDEVVTLNSR